MEIHYLSDGERIRSRALYEEVFMEDEPEFVDAYYRIKAADNRILAAEENGEIVSMIHLNPYDFVFRGEDVKADYIVAVATKMSFRHRGLMRSLLTEVLLDEEEEGAPFIFLMPADEAIYTPFDFRLMGNEDAEELSALSAEELASTYDLFVKKDELYKKRHIDWPGWESTPMMVRLVSLPEFVRRIGAAERQSLVLSVTDPIIPSNNGVFLWNFEEEGSTLTHADAAPELSVSIADLGSFLCGMLGSEELAADCLSENKEKVLEKLENIKAAESIYINEIV